jgi:hypothetical protein
VGTNGRTNDALVFSKSALNEALQQNILNIQAEGVFLEMMPFHCEQTY